MVHSAWGNRAMGTIVLVHLIAAVIICIFALRVPYCLSFEYLRRAGCRMRFVGLESYRLITSNHESVRESACLL